MIVNDYQDPGVGKISGTKALRSYGVCHRI
jgi:hypothetical protein